MPRVDALLALIPEDGLLHLRAGRPPLYRSGGALLELPEHPEVLTEEAVVELLRELLPQERWPELAAGLRAVHRQGEARFRLQVHPAEQGAERLASIHRLPERPPALPGLHEAALGALLKAQGGLILCTSPDSAAGEGTAAALVEAMGEAAQRLILTIEDPVRAPQRGRRGVVVQREVGADCRSAGDGLRAALRGDVDVLALQPLPLSEPGVAEAALRAAEGGVLVIAAFGASSAADAIDRWVAALAPASPERCRARLGRALRGLINQWQWQWQGPGQRSGARRQRGGEAKGAVAAEVLLGGPGLLSAVREGSEAALSAYAAAGRHRGMQTLEDSLAALCAQGALSEAEAYLWARDKRRFAPPL